MRRFLVVFLVLVVLAVPLGLPASSSCPPARRRRRLSKWCPGMGTRAIGALLAGHGIVRSRYAFDLWHVVRGGHAEGGGIPVCAAGDAAGGLQPHRARGCLHPHGDDSRGLQPFRHCPSRRGCATGIERELSGRSQPGCGSDCRSGPGSQKPRRLSVPRYLPLSAAR